MESGALFQALVASFMKVDLDRLEKFAFSMSIPLVADLVVDDSPGVCFFYLHPKPPQLDFE